MALVFGTDVNKKKNDRLNYFYSSININAYIKFERFLS